MVWRKYQWHCDQSYLSLLRALLLRSEAECACCASRPDGGYCYYYAAVVSWRWGSYVASCPFQPKCRHPPFPDSFESHHTTFL